MGFRFFSSYFIFETEHGDGSTGTEHTWGWEHGREHWDGSVETGVWGCDCGDGSMGTGEWEREHGNGRVRENGGVTVGTGEWEREHGNGRVRKKRWDRSVGMERLVKSVGMGG